MFHLLAALALGLCMSLLSACGDDHFPDYRYKMTIEVDTPDGVQSFSSVRAVEVTETPDPLTTLGKSDKTRVSGDAVILDLPGHTSPVFALLTRPDDADYAWHVPRYALMQGVPLVGDEIDGQPLNPMDRAALDLQHMLAVKGAKALPQSISSPWKDGTTIQTWPLFVAFDDIGDPKTVHEVTPDVISVRRVTIEITDEPVTKGIEGRLRWLANQRGALVKTTSSQSMFDKTPAQRATEGDFTMKEIK